MNIQNDRSKAAADKIAPPQEHSSTLLEIPLGTPVPRSPGVVEWLSTLWLANGWRISTLILLGGLMIAGGLASAFNYIVACWTYEQYGGCPVGLNWYRKFGPSLSGTGTFGPALVFLGTTLFAMAYALKLKAGYRRETTES